VRERIVQAWSGGKDSCLTLYELQQGDEYEVVALLTTVTQGYDRISMHGVRRALLEEQSAALGLPLRIVSLPEKASNEQYEMLWRRELADLRRDGIGAVAFGDLFLEDVRRYREENLAKVGMRGVFPLWQRDTTALAREFVRAGFRAVTVCVDPAKLDPSFVGQHIDRDFLGRLPAHVDPCGENGEFHSFVFDGPLFARPVLFTVGKVVERDGFWFGELVPAIPCAASVSEPD
jgi:uncharacterized protein (TIGR00290 family)